MPAVLEGEREPGQQGARASLGRLPHVVVLRSDPPVVQAKALRGAVDAIADVPQRQQKTFRTARWCDKLHIVVRVPRWDSALMSGYRRWGGQAARQAHRDPTRLSASLLSWRRHVPGDNPQHDVAAKRSGTTEAWQTKATRSPGHPLGRSIPGPLQSTRVSGL